MKKGVWDTKTSCSFVLYGSDSLGTSSAVLLAENGKDNMESEFDNEDLTPDCKEGTFFRKQGDRLNVAATAQDTQNSGTSLYDGRNLNHSESP